VRYKQPLVFLALFAVLAATWASAEVGVPLPFPPEPVAGGDPNVTNAVLIYSVDADYPTGAIREQLADEVYVAFVVNETGNVEQARAFFSRHEVFEAPAVAAVSKWKFTPAKLMGHPISTRMVVAIRFSPVKK
jgi:TonB family protein